MKKKNILFIINNHFFLASWPEANAVAYIFFNIGGTQKSLAYTSF